jgi:predicted TIM-barrel fold metal-dependent hydrolase
MSQSLDYLIHDADNHYYEPDDFCTRHIEAKYKEKTYWLDRKEEGVPARMYLGDERCKFFSVGVGDSIGPPGIMKAFLKGETSEGGSPALSPENGLAIEHYVNHKARIAKMDEQGVEKALMLPTAGIGLATQLTEAKHQELLYPTLRAFNRWLEEDWGYGTDGRIYGAPMLALDDLDQALVELERLIAASARFICVMGGPIAGMSPGDTHFDPFWARVQEARIGIVYHIGSTSLGPAYNTAWGLRAMPPSHRHSMMEYYLSFTDRPVADTIASLISDNLFDRFPDVRLLSVEYGSAWVQPMLGKLDSLSRLYSKDLYRFGTPSLTPTEAFRRNVWVAPFYENDVVGLSKLIGAEHVLNGSDYPHPEGLAEPIEFLEELDGLSAAETRRIMRDNFEELTF